MLAAVAAFIFTGSPKHGNEAYDAFDHADRLLPAHFGVGVSALVALSAWPRGVVVLCAVVWSVATLVTRSFTARGEERAIAAGAGVLVLGALPFMAIGFPFATRGIFDRGNLFADLGTAVVVAGVLGLAWRLRRPVLAEAVAVAAIAVLAAGNVADVRDWRIAAADGRRLLHATLAAQLAEPAVVVPLPDTSPGIQMFIQHGNLSSAIALRGGGYPGPPVELARTVDEGTALTAP